MAEIIKMPKMSDTMTEGVIAAWLKKVGDQVKSGDILAEVETDKATMELENYEDGVLLYIGPKEKDAVPVDGVLAIVGKAGEDITGLLAQAQGGAAPRPPKLPNPLKPRSGRTAACRLRPLRRPQLPLLLLPKLPPPPPPMAKKLRWCACPR
jgi:pyruvate dehydrogenase E2 component (dihydrolipoamide acetyltransferase)